MSIQQTKGIFPNHLQLMHYVRERAETKGADPRFLDKSLYPVGIIDENESGAPPGFIPGDLTVTLDYYYAFREAYHEAIEEKRKAHENKAKTATRRGTWAWHEARARGMRTDPLARRCEITRYVSCGCKAFGVGGCGQRTCAKCAKRKWGSVRRRVLRSLGAHSRHGWRLMTLGGPPRDSPHETIRDLQRAWSRIRAQFFKYFGKSFPYIAIIELGEKNGHVHMHVVTKWPDKWIDYTTIGGWWESAYSGAGAQGVDFAKHPKTRQSVMSAKNAAIYAAKYATKGTELLKQPPERAARIMAALAGARMVRASRGFWVAPENKCKECGGAWTLAQGSDVEWCDWYVHEYAREPRLNHSAAWDKIGTKFRREKDVKKMS